MRVYSATTALIFILCLSRTLSSAQTNCIEKVLVFAQSNSVRIECRINASEISQDFNFDASITHGTTGNVLWSGKLPTATGNLPASFSTNLANLAPELWEPHSPVLYHLTLTASANGISLATNTTRFGFRTVEIRNGQFYLNGLPIFLRGVAINPPGRTIPSQVGESREFARKYVAFLKSQNVNILRISTDTSKTWFDACDELGMLMYAGRYGSPPESSEGKQNAPEDYEASIKGYKALFEECVNHPSIIMYYLSNELPVSGSRGSSYSRFLQRAHLELKEWDPTRPYIGNAGYGEGREGDVCDVHRYWGWYYNSFLTYYNLRDSLRESPLFGAGKNQPLTFTECVGAFTGSSGEFNVVRSKQLGPRLGWIGSTDHPLEDSSAYQCRVLKEAAESFRRMRPMNHRLAGLMPFTILFYNWAGIDSFEQMRPKPAMEQLRISYQPVLLSWEMWTPQVYAGTRLKAIAHVINDNSRGSPLSNAVLHYTLTARDGRRIVASSLKIPSVAHFSTWKETILIDLPVNEPAGDYLICGSIENSQGIVSTNWTGLFIAEPARIRSQVNISSAVGVYDTSGRTLLALKNSGIDFKNLDGINENLSQIHSLVIGENSWDDHLSSKSELLRNFVKAGGRILCLQQSKESFRTDWLPAKIVLLEGSANDSAYPPRTRPHKEQSHVNIERADHLAFQGLSRDRFALWSDYTGWDQTKPGFPKLFPVTSGFKLENPKDLARTAVLADYDRGLEGVALCEMFEGKGSVMLCGLDIACRSGLDPVADRLLVNLVAYAATQSNHHCLPLITRPIRWGILSTEQGAVIGSLNGLIVNTDWLRGETQRNQEPLAPNTGAWNMMPGDQFIPSGRNPYGHYEYTTGSSLRSRFKENEGEGFVLVRTPAHCTNMLTLVRNPGPEQANLRITLNGAATKTRVAPRRQQLIQMPLPKDRDLAIHYSGPPNLILVETRFE